MSPRAEREALTAQVLVHPASKDMNILSGAPNRAQDVICSRK
jgi:hypothetical protein